MLVPLDTARQNGVETGLELGGGLRMRAGARWVIDGGLALAAPLDIVGGQAHLRLEPVALAEAWLRLRPWAALCGGVNVRVNGRARLRAGHARAARSAPASWSGGAGGRPSCSSSRWPGADRTDLIAGLYAGFTPS